MSRPLSSPRFSRICAPLTLGLGCLLIIYPALSPMSTLYFRDHHLVFHGWLKAVTEAYAQGQWALWNPFSGGGEPLAAYSGAMAYSPFLVLFAWFDTFETSYDLFVVAHVPVAAGGAYLLFRVLKSTRFAASLGALIFAGSGLFLSYENLLPAFESLAFAPWAHMFALRLFQKPSLRRLAAFGLFLGWHVQTSDPAFLFGDVLFFCACIASIEEKLTLRVIAGRAAYLCCGGILAFLITAVQTLPLIELLRGTVRGSGFSYEDLAIRELVPLRLINLFIPGLSGELHDGWNIFGSLPGPDMYIRSIYSGVIIIPGFALASVTKRARPFIWVGLVSIAMALGAHTPVHHILTDAVPGLGSSRYPVKYLYGLLLCLGSWTAVSISSLEELGQNSRKHVLLAGGIAMGLVLGATTIISSLDVEWLRPYVGGRTNRIILQRTVWGGASHAMLVTLLLFAVSAFWAKGKINMHQFTFGCLVITTVDLSVADLGSFRLTPLESFSTTPAAAIIHADHPASPVIFRHVATRRGPQGDEVGVPSEARLFFAAQRIAPSFNIQEGLREVLERDLNSVRSPDWAFVSRRFGELDAPARKTVLRRLGVTHILSDAPYVDPELALLGTVPLPDGPPLHIFRLPRTRPFVSLADKTQAVTTIEETVEHMANSSNIDTVFINARNRETAVPFGSFYQQQAGTDPSTTTVVSGSAGTYEIDVATEEPRWLIVRERLDNGWHAQVDGRSTEIFAADGLLAAIPVPASPRPQRVSLHYEPTSFQLGLRLTILGFLLTGLLFILGTTVPLPWWRRRTSAHP